MKTEDLSKISTFEDWRKSLIRKNKWGDSSYKSEDPNDNMNG